MLYLITLGFDEKFAIRSMVSKGLKPGDEVVILMPEGSVGYSQSKAERAFNNLKQFVETVQPKLKIIRVEVEVRDLTSSVAKIQSVIRSSSQREIYANLSGGMRILIIEVLLALVLLGIEAEIEIELEDMEATVKLYSSYFFKEELDWTDRIILSTLLNSEKSVHEIVSEIERDLAESDSQPPSRVTVWRRILELEKKRLVDHRNIGKMKYYKLTNKGEFLVKLTRKG